MQKSFVRLLLILGMTSIFLVILFLNYQTQNNLLEKIKKLNSQKKILQKQISSFKSKEGKQGDKINQEFTKTMSQIHKNVQQQVEDINKQDIKSSAEKFTKTQENLHKKLSNFESNFEKSMKQMKIQDITQHLSDSLDKSDSITIYGTQLDFYYPNFMIAPKKKKCLYTLTSQLSLPRLDRVSLQLKSWKECVSIALHINIKDFEKNFHNSLFNVKSLIKKDFPDVYENTDIHLHVSEYYKINTLRNFAMKLSPTDLIFIVDIDWIVSPDIHQILQKFGPPPKKTVYSLITLKWDCKKDCFYPHGQHMSDYDKWLKANTPYNVDFNFPYEPYAIGRKSEFPLFSPRFDFGGNDKVSFFFQLGMMDFKFIVLPNCSVTHYPHKNIEHWGTRSYERAVEQWHIFIKELRVLLPHKNIMDHYGEKK
jgi:hypothetical protein